MMEHLSKDSSLLFRELRYCFSDNKSLSHQSLWKKIELLYNKQPNKEKLNKIINVLRTHPKKLKSWATTTDNAEWDFSKFYISPFLSDDSLNYIPVSDTMLINAFFEKLFWLIGDCYPKEHNEAMSFLVVFLNDIFKMLQKLLAESIIYTKIKKSLQEYSRSLL